MAKIVTICPRKYQDYAINYILNKHTWNKRFKTYDKIINESLIP